MSSDTAGLEQCSQSRSRSSQVALILGNLWFVGDTGIRKRVLTLLHQKSATLAEVRDVLKELHRNIGDEGENKHTTLTRADHRVGTG